MACFRRARHLLRRFGRYLRKASGSEHQIGLGVAIGFFVSWLPILGIQLLVALAVCHLLRANKVVALLPIALTNPVTIIPVYSFNYWVGWKLVGGPPLKELVAVLKRMLPRRNPDAGWLESWWGDIRQATGEVLSMGGEMQLPLWLGSFLVALALAVPSYYLTIFIVRSLRAARARKKRERRLRRRTTRMDVSPGDGYTGENHTGQ